jgi:polyphosphate kinase
MQAADGAPITLDDPSLYLNRELSWLEFNRRVLEEAQDPQVPLLERLKFLAIFGSNLDEFFMVRVGGLQQKVQAGIAFGSGADRMPPREQLERINQTVREMVDQKYRCLLEDVLPALRREGIVLRGQGDLSEADRRYLSEVFRKEVFPVVTPLAIDPGHPFPHLLNKSLNLAVVLHRPRQPEKLFAVVQVPAVLPRFVSLPADKGHHFVALETVIRLHMSELFPGMDLGDAFAFRLSRTCSRQSRKRSASAAAAPPCGWSWKWIRPPRSSSSSWPRSTWNRSTSTASTGRST